VSRVAVFRDETNPTGIAQFGIIQAMATSVGLQVTPVSVSNSDEIASAVEAFAHSPNGGAIMTGGAMITGHRDLILNSSPAISCRPSPTTASAPRMVA
jgi:putative ABC transport system substrate-binding protein